MKRSTRHGKSVGSSRTPKSKTTKQMSPDESDSGNSSENEQSSKNSSTPTPGTHPITPFYSLRKRPQSGLQDSEDVKSSDATSTSLFSITTVSGSDAKAIGDKQENESRTRFERRASRSVDMTARSDQLGLKKSTDPSMENLENEQSSKISSTPILKKNPLAQFRKLRQRGQLQNSLQDSEDSKSSDVISNNLFSITTASKPDAKKMKTSGDKQDDESSTRFERRASRSVDMTARSDQLGLKKSSENEQSSKRSSIPASRKKARDALRIIRQRGQPQNSLQDSEDAKSLDATSTSQFSITTVSKPDAKKAQDIGDASTSRPMEHHHHFGVQKIPSSQVLKKVPAIALMTNYHDFWEGTSLELFNEIPPKSMTKLAELFLINLLERPEIKALRGPNKRIRWDVTFPNDPNGSFLPDTPYIIDFIPNVIFKLDNSISVPHVTFYGGQPFPLPDCHLFLSIPPFSAY